jgi:dimethylamine corrinoid protein
MIDTNMEALINSILIGDQSQAITETRNLLNFGLGNGRIISEGVETAMTMLDKKCTVEEFNLLEIMLSGRAAMSVMKELYPPGEAPPQTKGTIVIGALEGDVHDLGKNIVKMVWTASGYRVVDCGKDCPIERLVDTAVQEDVLAIGISGLLTVVIPQVRQVKERVRRLGLHKIKVIAGGAALKQSSVESLNVDFIAQTAFDGLRYIDQLSGVKR